MTDQPTKTEAAEQDSRRDFLNRAGKIAAVAPAAALLLAASTRANAADVTSGRVP